MIHTKGYHEDIKRIPWIRQYMRGKGIHVGEYYERLNRVKDVQLVAQFYRIKGGGDSGRPPSPPPPPPRHIKVSPKILVVQ